MSNKTRVRPKIPSLVVALFFILIGIFIGLFGIVRPTLSRAAQEPDSFRFRLSFEPRTLDWTYGDTPILITLNTMRGLFRVTKNGTITPDLVQKISKSSDEKVWTFQLQQGVRWSDGVPLAAKHLVDGIERLRDPRTASSYAHFISGIDSVRATSDHSIEFHLKKRIPFFPAILSHWVTFPVRSDLISKYKDYGTAPAHMAFLGPYQVVSWDKGEFNLAPHPYATPVPRIKTIRALVVTEDETAFNLYQTGKLDFVVDPGVSALNHPDLRTYQSPILYFVAITGNHPLTQNKKALQALSLALNRNEIPKVLSVNHRITTDLCPPEFCPKRFSIHDPSPGELLRSAGLGDLKKLKPLTLYFFEKPAMRDLAQWIQSQWKSKLGIEVLLDSTDVKSYWAKMEREPASLFLNSKGASYPDANNYFELFQSGNPQNYGKWSDSEYDRLVNSAALETSETKRSDLYAKASYQVLWENIGLIPLYLRSTQYLVKPGVRGFTINPMTGIDFQPLSWGH